MELFLDIQQHRDPPRHVVAHYCFDPSGVRFNTLLLRLTSARTAHPASTDIKAKIQAQVRAELVSNPRAKRVKSGGPSNNPLSPMPDNLQRQVPKQEGVPCCLRALCNSGCNSKLKDNHCGSGTFKKCHFIPDTLGKPLAQFASKRWGAQK